MKRGWIIDGQKQPAPPPVRIELLDSIGIERRMTPLPEVIEHYGMQVWYAEGGWVDTVMGDL